MMTIVRLLFVIAAGLVVLAHDHDEHDLQMPLDYVRFPYQAAYPGDNTGAHRFLAPQILLNDQIFPVTADSIFSGITTFAKLPWVQCLGKEKDVAFDIAFIGAPFVRVTFHGSSSPP